MSTNPIVGINTQIEVNLDKLLPKVDPLSFCTRASHVGLYVQYFIKDGGLWARVVGPFDTVVDFSATI